MAQTMIQQIANRYQILSLIGQGGMADVYRARDKILDRIVAIKVLRSKLSEDPMILVRFQREASAASVSYTHLDVYKRQQDSWNGKQGIYHIKII